MEQFNNQLQEVAHLLETRDNYQMSLGKATFEVYKELGREGLADFGNNLESMTGKKIAFETLRNYAWVYGKTHDLDLPEDIQYRARKFIAGTADPHKWAKLIKEQGLSSGEVVRLIQEENGVEKKHKTQTCPFCGKSWEA